MKRCWNEDIKYRPTAKDLDTTLMDFAPQDAEPQLEEKRKAPTKDMLYELFPKHIADPLKRGNKVEPEQLELVTVLSLATLTTLRISPMSLRHSRSRKCSIGYIWPLTRLLASTAFSRQVPTSTAYYARAGPTSHSFFCFI